MSEITSRICVKNLPKYIEEDRLRSVFSKKGEITDVKLMRTKDGKSRQFAFIGFHMEREAQEAIKYFNNSFLDTCRITCEVAWKVGDPKIPRPWSKYCVKKEKEGTEDGMKLAENNSSSYLRCKDGGDNFKRSIDHDDSQLKEFLQVTQPRINSKLWADDSMIAPEDDQNGRGREVRNQMKKVEEKLVSVNVDGDKNEDVESEFHNTHVSKNLQNSAHDDGISDMEYFRSRVQKKWLDSETSDDDNNDENAEDEDESPKNRLESQDVPIVDSKLPLTTKVKEEDYSNHSDTDVLSMEKSLPTPKDEKDEILETGRLFVRNLPYTAT